MLLLAACADSPPEQPSLPPLKIKHGEVIGSQNTRGGKQWRGIPYAQPPLDELRWQAPREPNNWSEPLLTQKHRSACSQMAGGTGDYIPSVDGIAGSEDCLYLNVYSPEHAENLAVMLWVHGGSNTHGAADIYDGSRLAVEHNVIVVTINYRLGPLGWLRHPALTIDGDASTNSGNFGTLDILASLQWVQENIDAFGGDPDQVTLFGESAGGFNTLSLMLSPKAEGLFHRAIVQSGGLWFDDINSATAYPEDGGSDYSALELERQLRNEKGWGLGPKATRSLINQQNMEGRAEFLRSASIKEIFTVYQRLGEKKPDIPTVFQDGTVIRKGDPIALLSDRETHYNVPTVIGSNRDEIKLYYYQDPRYVDLYFDRYAIIKNKNYYDARAQYHSERWKYQGVDRIARALNSAEGEAVWAYRFDWDEQARPLGMKLDELLGASHGMEIPFVFGFTDSGGLFDPMMNSENTANREELSQRMRSLWTRFAKSGNPNKPQQGLRPEELKQQGLRHQGLRQQDSWQKWVNSPGGSQFALFDSIKGEKSFEHSLSIVDPRTFAQRISKDSRLKNDKERCEVWASLIRKAPELWPVKSYTNGLNIECSEYPFETME